MRSNNAVKTALSLAVFSVTACVVALAIYFIFFGQSEDDSANVSATPVPTVIIDAGHGGMDGGCVADMGTEQLLEKNCNLDISKTLAALFRISGYNVVMTRENDVMLDIPDTTGSAKMRDLKSRLNTAAEHPDAIFISIHCNKFPDPKCKGLQVYYTKNREESKQIAQEIQDSAVSLLQPENKRQIKPADSSIYLLHKAKQPAVLIECGFLSNPEEAELLFSPAYQKKLALSILIPMICDQK